MIKANDMSQQDLAASLGDGQEENLEINIGQNGDIINRYRIPIDNNEVDFNLKLPDDSDSSKSSKQEEESPRK